MNADERVVKMVAKLVGQTPDMLSEESIGLIFDRAGLGIPNYTNNAAELHATSKAFALADVPQKRFRVSLVTNHRYSGNTDSQLGTHANDWMFYDGGMITLRPTEYRIALAVRIRVNPMNTPLPIGCACGTGVDGSKLVSTATAFIEHVLACDRMTRYTHLHRHNGVMYALVGAARRYGIRCSVEPSFYTYEDGRANRPDIIFYTVPALVTDVTIWSPDKSLGLGQTARRAAQLKTKKHRDAVQLCGHKFLPFAMEVYGHIDKEAITLVNRLSRELPEFLQKEFIKDTLHDVSTALMQGVAISFIVTHAAKSSFFGSM